MDELMAQSLARIERRMMDSNIELPEAVRLFRDVIYGFDPRGDLTWALRSAREVHAKVVRSLRKAGGHEAVVASKMSLCAWFEAWRQSDVLEENVVGNRLRFTLDLLQMSERHEAPRPTTPIRLMEFVTDDNLRNLKNLTEVAQFEDLKMNVGAMVELQTILAKESDTEVFIYISA